MSSSRSDDLEPHLGTSLGTRENEEDFSSESEAESRFSQDFDNWTDSFVVLMSDSFEVISLPADMMQVPRVFALIIINSSSIIYCSKL